MSDNGARDEGVRDGMTRRAVIGQAAMVAGGALVARPGGALAGQRSPGTPTPPEGVAGHGGRMAQRGVEIAARRGRHQEGRFGLMFKDLSPFQPPDDLLVDLARNMADPGGPPVDNPLDNPEIPAGFTFLGQFIDHDMTLDTTPLTDREQDPDAMRNFDTPHFDLASMYGAGPLGSPSLYEPDGRRLRLVRVGEMDDLPRNDQGVAVLGDARNDENVIIAQLHIAFMKFHNRLVADGHSFAAAQQLTRWHFQWIIVHDFLEHVVGEDVVARFLRQRGNSPVNVKYEHYKPKNPHRPMMPIEYSVAAYRFGHSMVRGGYVMNADTVAPMFTNPSSGGDLSGSRVIPGHLKIDWTKFFRFPDRPPPANLARRIDTGLSQPLHDLPAKVVPLIAPHINDLAARNLLRGARVGLPSGQDVARAMGVTPLTNTELGLTDARWGAKAPLWYYILKEAEVTRQGLRLGEVGGRIVAETILGILDKDRGSYFHARWRPSAPAARKDGVFTVADLLTYARA